MTPYNVTYSYRLLMECRSGLKMQGLMEAFLENQEVVIRQNGYHGPNFRATRCATQGGLASPKIFNVAVDSMFFHWIYLTVDYETVI